MEFAIHAIRAQPVDYARSVTEDFLRTFGSRLDDYPSAPIADRYLFDAPPPTFDGLNRAKIENDLRSYTRGDFSTTVHEPAAGWISDYQRYVSIPAPSVGGVLVAGAIVLAIAAFRRRECSRFGLVFALALLSLLLPPMTAGFDYRYVPPALPLLGMVLAFSFMSVGDGRKARRNYPSAVEAVVAAGRRSVLKVGTDSDRVDAVDGDAHARSGSECPAPAMSSPRRRPARETAPRTRAPADDHQR